MTKVYEQHEKAFSDVSAFVVLKGAERVATIAFKFPRDGAGRLYAYVHWLGVPMVRGWASGGGYDKKTAAASSAAGRIEEMAKAESSPSDPLRDAFIAALSQDGGYHWDDYLRRAEFTVVQAV
jgi:hypothetical protein